MQDQPHTRPDYYLLHDRTFHLLACSDAFAALIGRTADEIVGRGTWDPEIIEASAEREAAMAIRLAALRDGDVLADVAHVRTPNGDLLRIPYTTKRIGDYFLTTAYPLEDIADEKFIDAVEGITGSAQAFRDARYFGISQWAVQVVAEARRTRNQSRSRGLRRVA